MEADEGRYTWLTRNHSLLLLRKLVWFLQVHLIDSGRDTLELTMLTRSPDHAMARQLRSQGYLLKTWSSDLDQTVPFAIHNYDAIHPDITQ